MNKQQQNKRTNNNKRRKVEHEQKQEYRPQNLNKIALWSNMSVVTMKDHWKYDMI